MTECVSILVMPARWSEPLRPTLEAALDQTDPAVEVLLLDTGRPDPPARAAAAAYARTPGVRVVPVPAPARTAWLEGVHAVRGAWVVPVAEGEVLHPAFCAEARAAVARDPAIDWVAAPSVMDPGGGPVVPELPVEWSEETLVGTTWAAPMGLMVRRERFAAVAGETEPNAPAAYAWLLGLHARGARGTILARPGVRHLAGRETAYRATLDPDTYARAVAALLVQYGERFALDPATAIFGRERLLRELVREHRARVERRDAGLARLRALMDECGRLRTWLQNEGRAAFEWGDFERSSPVSRTWGYDRGTPVDRPYIEAFIARHAADVHGRVLEVQENDLTRRFGGDRVTASDVIDWNPGNPRATIVDDLRRAATVPDDTYDCIILTQTLHVIDDMRAVLAQCARILKPGGVLLATLPCASRVCLEYGPRGDFWRVTEAGARTLVESVFPPECVQTSAFGNVKVTAAFLYGLAAHEVDARSLETTDPYFPLLIGVRAVKPAAAPRREGTAARTRAGGVRPAAATGAILLYHRVAWAEVDPHGLAIDPETFARQMAILRQRFVPLPLDAFAEAARQGTLPPGAVAVTFDDGYADVWREALPILEATGVPATCFVITGAVDAGREFWWDALARALLGPQAVPPRLSLAPVGLAFEAPTDTPEARRSAHEEVYRRLRASAVAVREEAVAYVLEWSGANEAPETAARPLTLEELRRLAASPLFAIGAHGVQHAALPERAEDEQRAEVVGSKRTLEHWLGRPIEAFAYPYGAWDPVTVRIVREAGFRLAVTCDEAPVRPGGDPWRFPRVEVRARVGAFFERRLRAVLDRP
jgi:peptidoglycan/xylan/chitin deacetylase (PgdA/CDA1 family)/SAM-dependent methyltransferase